MADDMDDLIAALCSVAAMIMEDSNATALESSARNPKIRLEYLRAATTDTMALLAAAEVVHRRAMLARGDA